MTLSMIRYSILLLLLLLLCHHHSDAWIAPAARASSAGRQKWHYSHHIMLRPNTPTSRNTRLCDTSASTSTTATPHIIQLSGDEPSIQQASRFMVESFWLGNERVQLQQQQQQQQQHQRNEDLGVSLLSQSDIGRLVQQQAIDFTATYGEIMGTRLLDTALLAAVVETNSDSSSEQQQQQQNMIGMVSLQVCILDHATQNILNAELSEGLLKNAVASLGPKQRRLYKNSSAQQIAAELLPTISSQQQLVCCLCNLSVAPTARRRGIAALLCRQAEVLAQAAGFDELYLAVEVDNVPARVLYEQTLGYETVYTQKAAPAMRIDLDVGQFVQTQADTLILKKKIV